MNRIILVLLAYVVTAAWLLKETASHSSPGYKHLRTELHFYRTAAQVQYKQDKSDLRLRTKPSLTIPDYMLGVYFTY